jgi:hypothetical protein
MKTLILTVSMMGVLLISSGKAQNNDHREAPAKVKSAFTKLYPQVKDVKWHTEEGNYDGKFNKDGKEMSVQINSKGELVQEERYLNISDLPKPIQDYLSKNYAGLKFNEVSEIINAKSVKHYQAESKDKLLIFYSKGKFIKTEKNEEKDEDDDDD